MSTAYNFCRLGRVIIWILFGFTVIAGSATATETLTYSYDALGRLVAVNHSGGPNTGKNACYSLDSADNRTNLTVGTSACGGGGGGGVCSGVTFTIASNGAVTEGANSTFTVTKSGSTSANCSVNYSTSDGSAVAASDYTAKLNQTLSFTSAQTSQTITIVTADDSVSEPAETFSVTLISPSDGGQIGSPSAATGTLNDNDGGGCIGVTFTIASNGAVTEGVSSVFTVTKSGSTTSSCSVNYATSDGSAAAGADYTAASGTLTFTSAQTSKTVSVVTTDDTAVESAETFKMTISGATGGAAVGMPSIATATINDNDTAAVDCSGVTFSIAAASPTVIEGATATFTVTKTGSATGSCSVSYMTINGFATAGSDYTATSGSLAFTTTDPATKTISVSTTDDTVAENPEDFLLRITQTANGVVVATSDAYTTINDNDATSSPPSFSINDVTLNEGSDFQFTITKAGSNSTNITVNWATASGTATAGLDYTTATGSVAFGPTDVTKTLVVHTTLDSNPEGDETFFVNLSGTGLTFTDAQGVGTITDQCSAAVTASSPDPAAAEGTSDQSATLGDPTTQALPTC